MKPGTVYVGDCVEVMASWPDECVDAIVTDPPYHLTAMTKRFGKEGSAPAKGPAYQRHNAAGFMGQEWDGGDVAFRPETWAAVLRVLKPGGHMVAFGGTRTFHRLARAIEDAGFEIRDTLCWLYGSGFPKSLDVSKAIDKATGAEGSWVREDHPGRRGARRNPGAILNQADHRREDNPEGFRHVYAPGTDDGRIWRGWGTALKPAYEPIVLARKPLSERNVAANVLKYGTGAVNVDACRIDGIPDSPGTTPETLIITAAHGAMTRAPYVAPTGRWPANVVLDSEAAALLDAQSGERASRFMAAGTRREGIGYHGGLGMTVLNDTHGDTGGASRFFYTAKADSAERSAGLGQRNGHPTVKPVDLMAWLVKLVTPPGGIVLDPFLGSGSTALAAQGAGFQWVGIELSPEYAQIAMQRIGMFATLGESA